tara:strand:- start:194 stop:355 length:162 start_codon:yes stop_codon:yes gene_type:complete
MSAAAPVKKEDVKMSAEEIRLIQWEEWALSLEEHFHAQELHARNPDGVPMGHR